MTNRHFEQKDGQGALFKNEKKEKPSHADYTGSITVEGQQFYLNGWIKKSPAGRTYMSVSAMPKQPPGRAVKRPPVKADVADDLNDEIGF
jgi:hypothetical protein